MESYLLWLDEQLNKIPIIANKRYKNYTLENVIKNNCNNKNIALEFGVFKGKTINIISKYFNKVYGFDSFEGLPEKWDNIADKGFFKVDKLPEVNKNVKLIKGLFQDTLEDFLKNLKEDINFIHIDCDLYSSTNYIFNLLYKYDKLKKNTIIVFDELINYNGFENGEIKALYDIHDKIKFKWLGTHGKVSNLKDSKKDWTFSKFRNNGYQQECALIIL